MLRRRQGRAILRAQISALLEDLGPTAQAVADNLEAVGITGVPHSGSDCAVARYINAVVGPDNRLRKVAVGRYAVTVVGKRWCTLAVVAPIPEQLRHFIVRFDRHEYPKLIVPQRIPSEYSNTSEYRSGPAEYGINDWD